MTDTIKPPLPEPVLRATLPFYDGRDQFYTAEQMHAYADAAVAAERDTIDRLRAALRMVGMLGQLGGMMPGTHQIVQTVVEEARAALGE